VTRIQYAKRIFVEGKLASELAVQYAQMVYSASFVSPAFELWGEGRKITQGIYETFSPFGVKLANIKGESGANAAEQIVTVSIGSDAIWKFKFEGVEFTCFRYSQELAKHVGAMLSAFTNWIRSAAPSVRFASHQLSYSAHCTLEGSSGESFLRSVAPRAPTSGGNDRGTGLIFHWDLPGRGSSQLVIDKSVLVNNGLYVALNLLISEDVIDFEAIGPWSYHYMASVLGDLGLAWQVDKSGVAGGPKGV